MLLIIVFEWRYGSKGHLLLNDRWIINNIINSIKQERLLSKKISRTKSCLWFDWLMFKISLLGSIHWLKESYKEGNFNKSNLSWLRKTSSYVFQCLITMQFLWQWLFTFGLKQGPSQRVVCALHWDIFEFQDSCISSTANLVWRHQSQK